MPEAASLADENPVAKAYRVWSSTCPFTSRSTMLVIAGSYILSWFLPNLGMALNSTPYWTIVRFEVYRVATTVFSSGSLMTTVFGLMSFNNVGPKLERSFGSTGLLALIGTLTVLTNVVFIALCLMLMLLGEEEALFFSSAGIWNLIISLTAIECMASPNTPRRFFVIPFDIPGKYYPLFLTFIFGFMRQRWMDLFCAVGVGYAYANGRLDRLKPSRSRLAGWESGCLSNFIQRSGYIINGAALGDEALATALNNPADHPSNQGNSGGGGDGGGGGGFSSFFGGGGQGEGGGATGESGSGLDGGESGFGSNNVIKKGGTRGGKGGKDSFAGSGQTLGGGGGGRQSGRSQTQHDPETARLARLAALEGRGAGGGGRGASGARGGEAAVPLMMASDDSVLALQDMGFTAAEANEALQYTNGDVEAAASYLAT